MIARDRLVRLLTAQPAVPVVTLIAPPGYGKTVLLAQWAAAERRPVAWLTLDDFDNVPSIFLAYIAAAIDRIQPVDPSLRAAIATPGPRILAAAVPRLVSELHRMGRPLVLVLDDAHRLTDRSCLDALTALVEHLPAGVQVVLAARAVPDLPIARLRARGQLVEIGQADLAFSAAEAGAMATAAGMAVGPEEAAALARRTEGWAAAIYLAALASRRGDVPPAIDEVASGRAAYIADYLRLELIEHLDDADLAVLTRCSILEIIEPGIAEAVVDEPGASDRLRSLAGRNNLILRLDGESTAFRCHKLLRDFLRVELEHRQPGIEPELHRRAAAWYATAGRIELAVEHALRGDRDTAARLVVRTTLPSLYSGHGDKLDRWLRSFERDAFTRHPPLAVMGAWIHLLNGRGRAADELAEIAERASYAGDPGDGSSSFDASRAILRCVMARRGPEDMLANARFAVSAETASSPWRTNALLMLGVAHVMCGDAAEAEAALAEAMGAGAIAGATAASAWRASMAIARRDWRAAEGHARASEDLATRAELTQVLPTLMTFAVSARIAIHHGDHAAARDALVKAQIVRPLASEAAPWFSVGALLELARAYLALSDTAGARSVLAEAEAIARARPSLGTLGTELRDLRRRLNEASSTLAGATSLTAAELRLLPILSTPLTFKEIGGRVFLSHHTVKTHAISIYGKLQVSSRSEAIERAIELGLLEPFPASVPDRTIPRA